MSDGNICTGITIHRPTRITPMEEIGAMAIIIITITITTILAEPTATGNDFASYTGRRILKHIIYIALYISVTRKENPIAFCIQRWSAAIYIFKH